MGSRYNNSACFLGIWICVIAALFYCYEFVLRAIPGIMVHQLMSAYHVSASSVALISASYYYLYTPLQLPAGILIDRYGPRLLLAVSVLLCTVGSWVMYVGNNLALGIFSQLIIGAGSAFAFVGALKLAANWLPIHRFALFSGLTTTLGMIGAVATDVFLIDTVHSMGWRQVWLLMGFVGLLISLLIFLFVKDSPGAQDSNSLDHKNEQSNLTEFTVALRKLATSTTFWLNSIIGGILFLPITVFGTLWGIPFLMDAYGFNHSDAGFATSMIFLGMAIGGPLAGLISGCITNRLLLLKISALIATSISSLILLLGQIDFHTVVVLFFLLGLILGAEVLVFPIATELVDKKYAGTAVAATNFVLMTWGIYIQPLVGKILDNRWQGTLIDGRAYFSLHDYQIALAIVPICCLCAFLLCFVVRSPSFYKKMS